MTTNMTTHSVCCRLSRDPAQVRHARRQARQALSRWGLGEHADLAELIVSELATNAIRHGHGAVRVCVSYANGDLRVDVHDDGAGRPTRQQANPDDDSGRGLALLDGLIRLHGGRREVANDTTGHGKTVYVMICLAADPGRDPGDGRISRPRGYSAHESRRQAVPARAPPARRGVLACPGASHVSARAAGAGRERT